MRHSLSWIGTGIRLCDVVRINPVKIKNPDLYSDFLTDPASVNMGPKHWLLRP